MCHRSLNQVSCTIKFMIVAQIGPTLLRLNLCKPEIEISVRLLQCEQESDGLINERFKLSVWICRQAIACGLYPFGDIRFPEHIRDGAHSRVPVLTKSCEVPVLLHLLIDRR